MDQPPHWTLEELTKEAERGRTLFKERRLGEAREDYTSHFDEALDAIDEFMEITDDLRMLSSDGRVAASGTGGLETLRYLTAPPTSEDDLSTLSGVSRQSFTSDGGWGAVLQVVLDTLDRHRFPWVRESRPPSSAEMYAARTSTAALVASRRVLTARANESKQAQEQLVRDALTRVGYSEVAARDIRSLHQAPQPGHFCGESRLGGDKADVIARLPDFRTLALECKVSNSAVNSHKRVNHEAANKAKNWLRSFGTQEIVPGAVIAGVFNPRNLEQAQAAGLTIWWSHSIEKMLDWMVNITPAR